MRKKRTINELRQVKDAVYKKPKSHFVKLDERKIVRFNREELLRFAADLVGTDVTDDDDEWADIVRFVDQYFE